jgi:G3E family GTPase
VRHCSPRTDRQEKTASIVNEFGEVGVDGENPARNGQSISSSCNAGCLCCTLKGSLLTRWRELRAKAGRVERIIVEATGLAQPSELTETLADPSLSERVDVGPLVTVVDAAKFPKLYAMLGEFYEAQIESADILVLNKVDLVASTELDRVRDEIRQINPTADLLFAERGEVDPEYLLVDRASAVVAAHGEMAGQHGANAHPHDHDHAGHDPHEHAPAESFVLTAPAGARRADVERFFAGLSDAVWRAKGFMRVDGEPCLVQYAMGQLEITAAAERTHENVVFIGQDIDRAALERQWMQTSSAAHA